MPKKKQDENLEEGLLEKDGAEDPEDEELEEEPEDEEEFEEEDEEVEENDEEPEEEDDPVQDEVMRMTQDVPVSVVAVLGKKRMSMKDLVGLRIGTVVELGKPIGDLIDIVANGKLIAKGELVDIDGKLGVRVVKLMR